MIFVLNFLNWSWSLNYSDLSNSTNLFHNVHVFLCELREEGLLRSSPPVDRFSYKSLKRIELFIVPHLKKPNAIWACSGATKCQGGQPPSGSNGKEHMESESWWCPQWQPCAVLPPNTLQDLKSIFSDFACLSHLQNKMYLIIFLPLEPWIRTILHS